MAASADGVVHLAYLYGSNPAHVVYRRCAGACDQAASWQHLEFTSPSRQLANYVRLAVAADGRVHLLWESANQGGPSQTTYATCASNCLGAANWTTLDLTSLLQGTSAPYRGAPMVVDSAGRVSFITSTLTFGATVVLSTCASNCTSLSSWTAGIIRNAGSRSSLAAVGTALHLVMNNEAGALIYRTCSQNCTEMANWQESPPLFAHGEAPPVSLTATASGGLRVAYNQGTALSTEPPDVQQQNDRVLVWGCDGNCLDPMSWNGVLLGEARDGEDGLALLALGEALALAVTTSGQQTITVRSCESGFTTATNWQEGLVDSSSLMNADVDPYAAIGCTDSSGGSVRPSFAAWYPSQPALALSPTGSAAIVHAPTLLRTCPGANPTRLWGIGRLRFIP
ncbi:MAG: hypothetical protein AMXMBFR34_54190 [Myxococcaceae bacterium]